MSPRTARVALLALLVAAACRAEPETPAVPETRTVSSDDGGLIIEIPAGALEADVDISIRGLMPDEIPPELRVFEFRGTAYSLEPDRLRFTRPVKITRRLDAAMAGYDPEDGVPIAFLLSRGSDGIWETLSDLGVRLEGEVLVVTGTTTHLSTILALLLAASVGMEPSTVEAGAGEGWSSMVTLSLLSEDLDLRMSSLDGTVENPEVLEPAATSGVDESGRIASLEFVCRAPGMSEFTAEGIVVDRTITGVEEFLRVFTGLTRDQPVEIAFSIRGVATCS